MNKILTQILTESDNNTHCSVRWLAVIGFLAGVIFTGWSVYHSNEFDILNYGTGLGAMLASVGVALKFKPDSPNSKPDETKA